MLNGMAAHADWAEEWMPKYEITDSNIHSIVQKEIGIVFTKVLEDAGVYKSALVNKNWTQILNITSV